MTRKIWISILLLSATAIFFLYKTGLMQSESETTGLPFSKSTSSTPSKENMRSVTQSKSGEPFASIRPLSSTVGLPAAELPLANIFSDLRQKAILGNFEASCRLAVELQRCSNAKRALEAATMMAESPNTPANMAENMLKTNEALGSICNGVTPQMLSESYKFQKIAADNGEVEHARWLVVRPEIDQQNFLNNLDAWDDYRQRAEAFVRAALNERRGEDLELLLNVYAPDGAVVSRPPYIVEDNITFLALLEVAQQRGLSMTPAMLAVAQNIKHSLTQDELKALSRKNRLLSNGFTNSKSGDYLGSLIPASDRGFCQQ